MIPAANVLTKNCKVSPKSSIDGLLCLNYSNGGLSFDLGYNLFWKSAESVTLTETFPQETYAVAVGSYNTTLVFGAVDAYKRPTSTYLTSDNLDTSIPASPSVLTHTIFGGFGYTFKDWEYPLMLGLGGGYEFGCKRNVPNSFTLHLKAGLAF